MQLHHLKPRPGAKQRTKRLGCGESSGHGKTSGKGHKGQKARSGGSIRLGFEGGQMPIYRRLPKRGFNNANFATRFCPVNLAALQAFEDGSTVDETALRARRLVTGRWDGVKILASGELKKKLHVVAHAFSEAARTKIEQAGGSATLAAAARAPDADSSA